MTKRERKIWKGGTNNDKMSTINDLSKFTNVQNIVQMLLKLSTSDLDEQPKSKFTN